MSGDLQYEVGPTGNAYRLPDPRGQRSPFAPEIEHATVDHWLITAPGFHPAWTQYVLCAVHLREAEGLDPPHKRTPAASHEIIVVALNPENGEWTPDKYLQEPLNWLSPLNLSEQIESAEDEAARDLCEKLVWGVLHGQLNPEPEGVAGAREAWQLSIVSTLEHIQHGGHPDA